MDPAPVPHPRSPTPSSCSRRPHRQWLHWTRPRRLRLRCSDRMCATSRTPPLPHARRVGAAPDTAGVARPNRAYPCHPESLVRRRATCANARSQVSPCPMAAMIVRQWMRSRRPSLRETAQTDRLPLPRLGPRPLTLPPRHPACPSLLARASSRAALLARHLKFQRRRHRAAGRIHLREACPSRPGGSRRLRPRGWVRSGRVSLGSDTTAADHTAAC
mmetsp:Transcript_14487/g.44355  ORF Transcript_14487/g.44355 Transcript_14487/m.44355 type:complete len:217 (+) Transcript_14487:784-1434(+)